MKLTQCGKISYCSEYADIYKHMHDGFHRRDGQGVLSEILVKGIEMI